MKEWITKWITTRIKKTQVFYCSFLRLWFTWGMICWWPNWRFFQGLSFERNPTSVALFVQKLYSNEGAGVKISKCSKRKKRLFLVEGDGLVELPWAIRHCSTHAVCLYSSHICVPQCLWWKTKHWLWSIMIKPSKSSWALTKNQKQKFLKYM